MPDFDYMSWNIQNFSLKHAEKSMMRHDVAYWIAHIIRSMQTDIVGIMEVTLTDGLQACNNLVVALNRQALGARPKEEWDVAISTRNVPRSHTEWKKADAYALVYNKRKVTVSNDAVVPHNQVAFQNRAPLYWDTHVGNRTVGCLLWHAPKPSDHQKQHTIKEIADAANLFIRGSTHLNGFLISGDFNYETGNPTVYAPLAALQFTGIFDGTLTTLTTLKNFIRKNRHLFLKTLQFDEAYFANAYDNIFLHSMTFQFEERVIVPNVVLEILQTNVNFQMVTRGQAQTAMENALGLSDHVPLVVTINVS